MSTATTREVARLTAQVTALIERIEALEAADRARQDRRGRRDALDYELLAAIAAVFPDRPFTAAAVMAARGRSVALDEALEHADLSSAREVGRALDRMCDGVTLCRGARANTGYRWTIHRPPSCKSCKSCKSSSPRPHGRDSAA